MAKKETKDERRKRLLPILTEAFIDLGFRRATTAELAARCQLRENELYRIWKDKKAMFIDAVQEVHNSTMKAWHALSVDDTSGNLAEKVLAHQAKHHGQSGVFRIVFAGLQETDDPDIRAALRSLYRKFHKSIVDMMVQHHAASISGMSEEQELHAKERAELAAWAIIGLGAIADIDRLVKLTSAEKRQQLIEVVGGTILELPVED